MSDLGTNTVLVARKWVDRRAVVDPLTGVVHTDPRTSGASDADDAALEWGLRLAEAWDAQLAAVTAGPANAEAVLRQPVALGATKAFRVDVDRDADSFDVAVAISHVARKCGASVVVCGDLSIDRGTGAVPAFVAALLGTPQALGLVDLQPDPSARGKLRAWRRLDGGRREHLAVESPCVLSVEGGSARLRRAGLEGLLDARGSSVEIVSAPQVAPQVTPQVAPQVTPRERPVPVLVRSGPFRPRTHVVAPPARGLGTLDRVRVLTHASTDKAPPRTLTLGPADAADEILRALEEWGEWDGGA